MEKIPKSSDQKQEQVDLTDEELEKRKDAISENANEYFEFLKSLKERAANLLRVKVEKKEEQDIDKIKKSIEKL